MSITLDNSIDFYDFTHLLDDDERAVLHRVREFMTAEVAPIINEHWTRAEFPVRDRARLRASSASPDSRTTGSAAPARSHLLDGLGRDGARPRRPSIATFFGVHGGLAMGSIDLCGSEEQKQRWLPAMARLEKIGAFGLTEPDVGSGSAGGLRPPPAATATAGSSTARKKWIGNATFADLSSSGPATSPTARSRASSSRQATRASPPIR